MIWIAINEFKKIDSLPLYHCHPLIVATSLMLLFMQPLRYASKMPLKTSLSYKEVPPKEIQLQMYINQATKTQSAQMECETE